MGLDRHTSEQIAQLAKTVLGNAKATQVEKDLANAALAECKPDAVPSEKVIKMANEVFAHHKEYSEDARKLAASIVSQEGK